MIKWISVKEYLPPFSVGVLIFPERSCDIFIGFLTFSEGKTMWRTPYGEHKEFDVNHHWARVNLPKRGENVEIENERVD